MIMTRLKQETQVYHQALERTPESAVLMSEHVSLAPYQNLLQKFYGFHRPVEERFSDHDWAEKRFNIEARRKLPLLEQDFALLGIEPATLPVCQDLPDLSTFPQMLGCLYVLEGSTLGGQIITRHLKKHLALNQFHYFSSYQEGVGMMWKDFGALASTAATSVTVEDQMVAAACETFIKLQAWLVA